MADIFHFWSEDLVASPSGDILLVQPLAANSPPAYSGDDEGTQRIYRRLMTGSAQAPQLSGEDICAPSYGAGVPARIGDVMNPNALRGVIKTQMFQEAAVATSPAPTITLTADPTGSVFVDIKYTNAQTGQPVSLSFNPTG